MKYTVIIALVICLFGCKNKSDKNTSTLTQDIFDFSKVISDANCKEHITRYGVVDSFVDDFINKTKSKNSKNLTRAIIAFYLEDGDVIHNYKLSILFFEDGTIQSEIFLNQSDTLIKSLKIKNFNESILEDFFDSLNEEEEITDKKFLLMDFKDNKVDCKYTDNVKFSSGDSIKTLSFFSQK